MVIACQFPCQTVLHFFGSFYQLRPHKRSLSKVHLTAKISPPQQDFDKFTIYQKGGLSL